MNEQQPFVAGDAGHNAGATAELELMRRKSFLRQNWSLESRKPDQASGSGPRAERRVGVLALMRQTLWDALPHAGQTYPDASDLDTSDVPPVWTTMIRIHASNPDVIRAIFGAQEEYVVFSPRPGLIWDCHLVRRIEQEIAAFEELGIPWFCLSADGVAADGRQYCASFFNHEPTLVPDRGRRLIVQSAGTIYAMKVSTFRALGLRRMVTSDLVSFINHLMVIAYGRGFGSFFTSGLYPCLKEHRSLSYIGFDEQLSSLNPAALLGPTDAYELFPAEVLPRDLVTAWIDAISSVLTVKHRISFVIRTLFRRMHLLRRCLISIEYLRFSLGTEVEIVLASDVDKSVSHMPVAELARDFPNLEFVIADGRTGKGYSRVRNLVAGLKASTGTRVGIIDDDDYYTPEAVSGFAQACEFGTEQLVIFDTQIVVEKWTAATAKHHREIISYETLFHAKDWATTLRGSNSIPLCGVIHPGWFVHQVAEEYLYDYDLSEDFVFHLMCLAHPRRPAVKVVEGVGAHQSHRSGDDNVSNLEDRTGWVLDTGNGLYQYLFEEGRTFDVISAAEVAAAEVSAHQRVVSLEAELARANKSHLRATEALARLIKRTAGRVP